MFNPSLLSVSIPAAAVPLSWLLNQLLRIPPHYPHQDIACLLPTCSDAHVSLASTRKLCAGLRKTPDPGQSLLPITMRPSDIAWPHVGRMGMTQSNACSCGVLVLRKPK